MKDTKHFFINYFLGFYYLEVSREKDYEKAIQYFEKCKIYLYDGNLQNCILVSQLEELGKPIKLIEKNF